MTKASPIATATCGTASSGDSKRRTKAKARVPSPAAATRITNAKEIAVDPNPMNRLTAIDWVRPGVEKRARHGSKLSSLRPSAGKYPNAGANTPATPANKKPNPKTKKPPHFFNSSITSLPCDWRDSSSDVFSSDQSAQNGEIYNFVKI